MKCLRASGEAAKGALKAQQTPIPSITYHLDMSKFVGASTCPYCSKNFRNAGPFDKHLRVSHPKLAAEFYNNRISRREGCNAPERGPENGIGSEPEVYDVPFEVSGSPDHDNDDEVEEEEEEEEEEADRHHRSDEESESVSEKSNNDSEPYDSQPTRRELYESSGRSYGCVEVDWTKGPPGRFTGTWQLLLATISDAPNPFSGISGPRFICQPQSTLYRFRFFPWRAG